MRQMSEASGASVAGAGRWLDLTVIGAALALLGVSLVPSHWTSVWMDREFTGTVAALANRLIDGVRLYGDGGHIPMPPLPFVLMRMLTDGHATWLWESALNFGFQALAIVLCYLALGRLFRPPVPLVATLLTVPTFLAIQKSVLYDSMVQAAVAMLAWLTAGYLGRRELGPRGVGNAASAHGHRTAIAALAVTSAVAVLTKQSTGLGACLGVALALVLCDRGTARERFVRVFAYGIATAAAVAALALALTPWADTAGLVRDVFLHGSEPKGGPLRMVASLVRFAVDIGRHGVALAPVLAVASVAGRLLGAAGKGADSTREGAGDLTPAAVVAAAALSVTALYAALVSTRVPARPLLSATALLPPVLWLGIFLAALLSLRAWLPGLLVGLAGGARARALAGVLAVTLSAALFHSLSTNVFRFSYDNNPLVAVAYAASLQVAIGALGWIGPRAIRAPAVVLLCFVVLPLRPWARLADQLLVCQQCTERWEEVRHLSGARLRPAAAGMRSLVALVRREAAPGEDVLLLPNDPNVEAWLGRDRPRLSSLFVFADQYWDRWVDADLAALRARPPRVIVIGPVRYWRVFHRLFARGRGAERLLDRVQDELLPACYELVASVPILHRDVPDRMDVFVLRR